MLYDNRVTYAETLCLGLVSVAILYTAMPLFQASFGILSQMAPSGSTAAALNKCLRQVSFLRCQSPVCIGHVAVTREYLRMSLVIHIFVFGYSKNQNWFWMFPGEDVG